MMQISLSGACTERLSGFGDGSEEPRHARQALEQHGVRGHAGSYPLLADEDLISLAEAGDASACVPKHEDARLYVPCRSGRQYPTGPASTADGALSSQTPFRGALQLRVLYAIRTSSALACSYRREVEWLGGYPMGMNEMAMRATGA
jgi:hypothetical protein